ncbi:MAG: DJ-1/PfpI family protein [Kutzneria sp.]|nr:DJ-1/PfpI family protein [Kutzneria sp.]
MDIAFVLYEHMTALDLVGPYEVLASHPEARPRFVADHVGAIRCDNGLTLCSDTTFDVVPTPELIVVPGSSHWRAVLDDRTLVDWLASVHTKATWTTSVCTGATLLAKAGMLAGRPATTHWLARDVLAALGAVVSTDRVVFDGDVVTCAGVSAGIDMALALAATLWGEQTARAIQLGIEYDPQPPFDSGSPDKASAEMVASVRAMLDRERATNRA